MAGFGNRFGRGIANAVKLFSQVPVKNYELERQATLDALQQQQVNAQIAKIIYDAQQDERDYTLNVAEAAGKGLEDVPTGTPISPDLTSVLGPIAPAYLRPTAQGGVERGPTMAGRELDWRQKKDLRELAQGDYRLGQQDRRLGQQDRALDLQQTRNEITRNLGAARINQMGEMFRNRFNLDVNQFLQSATMAVERLNLDKASRSAVIQRHLVNSMAEIGAFAQSQEFMKMFAPDAEASSGTVQQVLEGFSTLLTEDLRQRIAADPAISQPMPMPNFGATMDPNGILQLNLGDGIGDLDDLLDDDDLLR